MPRAIGQIDLAKNEAILEAAGEILAERGLAASMSLIARRAGVSKQTIYNHYGAKTDLIRAIATRRVKTLSAPLEAADADSRPEQALAEYARILMGIVTAPKAFALMRLTVQSAAEMPDLAREVYEAGPLASRFKLTEFLQTEADAGRLDIPHAPDAAELFIGMAIGHRQIRALLGLPAELESAGLDRAARDVAHRFVRAYAP